MWTYAVLHGPAYVGAKLRAHAWIYGNWSLVLEKRRHKSVDADFRAAGAPARM